jgi:hypothetical protein
MKREFRKKDFTNYFFRFSINSLSSSAISPIGDSLILTFVTNSASVELERRNVLKFDLCTFYKYNPILVCPVILRHVIVTQGETGVYSTV